MWDYIVVGAGSAGCIVAARLSEDPGVRVLLVEAGGSDRLPIIAMPGALPFVYQSKRIQWGYTSGPEPYLGGKTIDEKSGRVLGGTSSINAMIYNRGNPMDYDGWAAEGLPDWDYAHCLSYFKKMESFAGGPDEWRGGSGPMRISRAAAKHQLYDAFLRGSEQAGHPVTADHNGFRQEGAHVAQSFIADGLRWSASRAYLRPALARPNLEVATHGLVQDPHRGRRRGRCRACAARPGRRPAVQSRSRAVRGRGRIAQAAAAVRCRAGRRTASPRDRRGGRRRSRGAHVLRRTGLGTTNFFETGAFLRTRDDVAFPDVQYEFLPLTRQRRGNKLVPIPGFQFWMDLSRPASSGAVTLRSANPSEPPSIVFNHLRERQDVIDLIAAVRLARTMIRQPAWAKYRGRELAPGPDVTGDREIESFLRRATGTSYHPAGTCRMGSDPDAVVDSDARVTAVPGLRVVDASIMPKVVTANLNAPVMMMAEKISDRIASRAPLEPCRATYYRAVATK